MDSPTISPEYFYRSDCFFSFACRTARLARVASAQEDSNVLRVTQNVFIQRSYEAQVLRPNERRW